MAATVTATISSTPPCASLLLLSAPKSLSCSPSEFCGPKLSLPSSAAFGTLRYQLRKRVTGGVSRDSSRLWTVSAVNGDGLPSEAPVEKAQEVIPASAEDGAVSTIVSTLLFVAFIGLSILTIGVIYLAVQDFLQKREREKFEKEEAEKKKKGGKKGKVKARAGPRGFGQRIEDDDN